MRYPIRCRKILPFKGRVSQPIIGLNLNAWRRRVFGKQDLVGGRCIWNPSHANWTNATAIFQKSAPGYDSTAHDNAQMDLSGDEDLRWEPARYGCQLDMVIYSIVAPPDCRKEACSRDPAGVAPSGLQPNAPRPCAPVRCYCRALQRTYIRQWRNPACSVYFLIGQQQSLR